MRTRAVRLMVACAAALGGITGLPDVPPLQAQDLPARQIKLLVGFAPGGSSDVLARALAPEAAKRLGQEIIVINKPGGAGTIAVNEIAAAAPDGTTIGIAASATLTLVHMFQSIRPDLLEITEALMQAGRQRIGVATKADSPLLTFKDLVGMARANPGKVSIGSPGAGTSSELMVRAVAHQNKLQINIVPFQGDAPAATALLGGHVTAVAASAGSWAVHVREGGMRLLASLERDRVDVAPDVPSLLELGYPYAGASIQYVLGPKGLPAAVKSRLIEAFTAASQTPLYVDIATKSNLLGPSPLTGAALDRHLLEDRRGLAELVARLGLGKAPAK